MASKTIYTCDGCDRTAVGQPQSDMPADWRVVEIIISNVGGLAAFMNGNRKYDLCWHCQRALSDHMPNNWARVTSAVKK